MQDQQGNGHGDDFHVEVSESRAAEPTDEGRRPSAPRSPLERRLTPRQRAVRIGSTAGVVVLALLVLVASIPSVRDITRRLVVGPTATPTLLPEIDLFYMLPNPPGTRVLVDGRPLQRLPLPGTPPLLFTRGQHLIQWISNSFPLAPLQCVLTVPRSQQNTCPVSPGYILPANLVPPGSPDNQPSVIDLHETLASLPTSQATALTAAIKAALGPTTASAIVQPGEAYFYYQPGVAGHAVTATQPLRATVMLRLDAPGALGGCVLTPGSIQPCRAPDQDCSEICTLPGAAADSTWLAGALVSTYWSYATLNGKPVAQNIGELGLNNHLAVLLITYGADGWNVTPVIGHDAALPATDDLLCDPARNWLTQGPLSSVMQQRSQESAPHVTVSYTSDSAITDGCLVSISGISETGTPTTESSPALFLLRFGVLLAANAEASALWPALPSADASEKMIAQQLASV
jgi:hypothetical protein